jgi:hypothetical protein
MTDFLQRVSLTALGLSPLVQPLVDSRYALDSHRPTPQLLPGEERRFESTFESTAERTSQPDDQTLSPSLSSRIAEPSLRRAPGHTAADSARHEITETLPPASDTKKVAQSTDLRESGAIPFDESASPTGVLLNTEVLIEPEKTALTGPKKEARAHTSPTGEAAELWPLHTVYAESQTPPDVARRASERMDVRDAPPPLLNTERAPAAAHQGANTSPANESAQVRPGLVPESAERRRSTENAFRQSLGSEHEVEISAMSTPVQPRSNDTNSFVQATAARVTAQLLSAQDDRAADTSSGRAVRVTIGRIEVRALPPPLQPVEAVAPPSPKLSLDDYLRQHNGRSQ